MLIKRAYPNPLSLNRRASTIPTSLFLVSMPNTQNLRFCKPSSNYHESYRKTRFRKPAGYRKRWLATVVYRSNMRPGDSHRPFHSSGGCFSSRFSVAASLKCSLFDRHHSSAERSGYNSSREYKSVVPPKRFFQES